MSVVMTKTSCAKRLDLAWSLWPPVIGMETFMRSGQGLELVRDKRPGVMVFMSGNRVSFFRAFISPSM